MNLQQLLQFLRADHGPTLRRWARVAGAVLALVITVAWIAGECCYDLGRQLRLALEERNDQLAAAWVQLLGVTREAPATAAEHREPIALLPAAAVSLQQRRRARRARAHHRAMAMAGA